MIKESAIQKKKEYQYYLKKIETNLNGAKLNYNAFSKSLKNLKLLKTLKFPSPPFLFSLFSSPFDIPTELKIVILSFVPATTNLKMVCKAWNQYSREIGEKEYNKVMSNINKMERVMEEIETRKYDIIYDTEKKYLSTHFGLLASSYRRGFTLAIFQIARLLDSYRFLKQRWTPKLEFPFVETAKKHNLKIWKLSMEFLVAKIYRVCSYFYLSELPPKEKETSLVIDYTTAINLIDECLIEDSQMTIRLLREQADNQKEITSDQQEDIFIMLKTKRAHFRDNSLYFLTYAMKKTNPEGYDHQEYHKNLSAITSNKCSHVILELGKSYISLGEITKASEQFKKVIEIGKTCALFEKNMNNIRKWWAIAAVELAWIIVNSSENENPSLLEEAFGYLDDDQINDQQIVKDMKNVIIERRRHYF